MIGKKEAKRMDPEWATYTPIDVFYTATGGSSTTAVIADTSAFGVDDVICNTTTGDVAIVNTIENRYHYLDGYRRNGFNLHLLRW
jgi:hypothetical protein